MKKGVLKQEKLERIQKYNM